jgi:hypothetical protein
MEVTCILKMYTYVYNFFQPYGVAVVGFRQGLDKGASILPELLKCRIFQMAQRSADPHFGRQLYGYNWALKCTLHMILELAV